MRETTAPETDGEDQLVELTLLLSRRQFDALEAAAARRGVTAARLLRLYVGLTVAGRMGDGTPNPPS